jgi:hypothetical protein
MEQLLAYDEDVERRGTLGGGSARTVEIAAAISGGSFSIGLGDVERDRCARAVELRDRTELALGERPFEQLACSLT